MNLHNINFRSLAREFCREQGFNNVDLVEAAMIKSAEQVVEKTSALMATTLKELREERAHNLRGS